MTHLGWSCEVCGAPKGQPCVWPLKRKGDKSPPRLLPGTHLARVLPPGRTKPQRNPERNEAAC